MRVGIFSDAYLPVINGVVTSIETLRKGLMREGHEVFIISNHGKIYDIEFKDNVLLLPGIKLKFLFDNKLSNPLQSRATEIIKQMNLDLIHVHTEFGVGLFARLIAKRFNIPLIYTYHTTWEDYTHYINPRHWKPVESVARKLVAVLSKQLAKPADAIITPSSKTKELLIEYGVIQPIHVIPTGVDLTKFKKNDELTQKAQAIRQQYGVLDEDTLLVFIGRLGEEKNLEVLIKAIHQIQNQTLKFMIVGAGPIFKELQEIIVSLNLTNRIFLTDKIPNDQIASYYHAANAFISASMTETQGLTFIEAMACGLPLFASDTEVLSDLLYENVNGFYFHSELECIDKLQQFISLDINSRNLFSEKSLELVKPYSDSVFIESILNLYEKVLETTTDSSQFVITQVDNHFVYFSNELTSILMHFDEDIINEYELEEDRIVNMKEISDLKDKDSIHKKMSKCITRLTYRDYSVSQMRQYLETIEPFDIKMDQEVINQLEKKDFLDDERFIYELLERYQEQGYGFFRIKKNLEKYQFDEHLNDIVLEIVNSRQQEQLAKQFELVVSKRYKGSKNAVKKKVAEKLIRQGFDASMVTSLIANQEFDYDEQDSCRNDFNKLVHLENDGNIIKRKLAQKGYSMETIYQVIGEEDDKN